MSSPYDRMSELLDQAMTPDIAGTPETHHVPQWAEDLEMALDALRLLRENPISNEAQRALSAVFEGGQSITAIARQLSRLDDAIPISAGELRRDLSRRLKP